MPKIEAKCSAMDGDFHSSEISEVERMVFFFFFLGFYNSELVEKKTSEY